MTRAERDRWVEALRSGKYKQCRGMMHVGDAFDPFGVLYDIRGASWYPTVGGEDGVVYAADGRRNQWPGWSQLVDWGIPEATAHDLNELNDLGYPFPWIADWIEANVPVTEEPDRAQPQEA